MLETVTSSVRESVTVQAALVGLTVALAAYHFTRRRYKLPPGPTALSLLGNILSFQKVNMYEKLVEWARTYGPVVTIYLGPIRCVVLNNSEVTLEALVKKRSDFAGRIVTYSVDKLTEGGKDMALNDYGPVWKLHRRLASKALRSYMAGKNLEKNAQEIIKELVAVLGEEKGPFDPTDHFASAVTNMLNGVCFGKHYERDDPELLYLMGFFKDLAHETGQGFLEDIFPPLRVFPTKRFRKIKNDTDVFHDFIAAKIQEHKATFDPSSLRDLTDMMLLVQQEEKDENPVALEDVYIRQTIVDIFTAGTDTTRMTLLWAVYHMALYPDIQKRCQAETDAVIGDRKMFVLSDRQNLCYTEAVLHESMRVSTVAPLGVPHKTIRDASVGGYDVPAGTMVIISQYALHRDPAQWPEPDKFRPERFLEPSGKMAPKPESWLPFSAGRRNCLGEGVARPELHLLLAGLLRHFTFSLPEGEPDTCRVTGGGFERLPTGLRLVVTPRN